jgi:hypothetical protein
VDRLSQTLYASDKVTNAGNTFMSEIKFKRSRFSRVLDHWISFSFFVFYLKVYLNMSRLSTVCVKRHPTGDKNRVCESLSTSHNTDISCGLSIIIKIRLKHAYNPNLRNTDSCTIPMLMFDRVPIEMHSIRIFRIRNSRHCIVYPWDVFLRYKRR